jgi:hypothetical protein
MKLTIFAAIGGIGRHALERDVTAVVHNPNKLAGEEVDVVIADPAAADPAVLESAVAGADAVVSGPRSTSERCPASSPGSTGRATTPVRRGTSCLRRSSSNALRAGRGKGGSHAHGDGIEARVARRRHRGPDGLGGRVLRRGGGRDLAGQRRVGDAMLLGRHLDELFAAAWPSATGDDAEARTAITTSWSRGTLAEATWPQHDHRRRRRPRRGPRAQGARPRRAGAVRPWPARPGRLDHGVVEELGLWVHPLVVGHGSWLSGPDARARLRLVGAQTRANGVVVTDEPAR